MRTCWVILAIVGFAAGAHADVVDTFENDTNQGTWRLTSNPDRLYRIEPAGGHPGAYLHGQVAAAVPTWYVSNPAANPFLGDYVLMGIRSMRFDLSISGGVQVPDRLLTLHLFTTLGTGDPSQGIDAYALGADISDFQPGWFTHAYALEADSLTIPPGWVITEGDGQPGTNADWRALMSHVEDVRMELGQPGFAYPNLNIWDLGLDTVTLSTSPVPGPTSFGLGAGVLGIAATRRRNPSQRRS